MQKKNCSRMCYTFACFGLKEENVGKMRKNRVHRFSLLSIEPSYCFGRVGKSSGLSSAGAFGSALERPGREPRFERRGPPRAPPPR